MLTTILLRLQDKNIKYNYSYNNCQWIHNIKRSKHKMLEGRVKI